MTADEIHTNILRLDLKIVSGLRYSCHQSNVEKMKQAIACGMQAFTGLCIYILLLR